MLCNIYLFFIFFSDLKGKRLKKYIKLLNVNNLIELFVKLEKTISIDYLTRLL